MAPIADIVLKTSGVRLIRQALESLWAKQLIDIRQEIPDQGLLAIVNEILSTESLEETASVQSVEVVEPVYKSIEDKIREAAEYCIANNINQKYRVSLSMPGSPFPQSAGMDTKGKSKDRAKFQASPLAQYPQYNS